MMSEARSFPIMALAALAVVACSNEDRVAALERRMAKLEGKIEAMQPAPAARGAASASSSATPDPEKACAAAKVAAHDAWTGVLPELKKVAAKFPARTRGGDSFMEECGGFRPENSDCAFAKVRAHNAKVRQGGPARAQIAAAQRALDAVTSGALKLRDAARAVKDDSKRPAIAVAKKTSDAAFEACKDVDP